MSYRCHTCGYRSPKWMGFCPQCRHPEELVQEGRVSGVLAPQVVPLGEVDTLPAARREVGMGEVDRVLGGGLVPGSSILLAGEPGVGKSTLLLQTAAALASRDGAALVASAEESVHQVALRARRLGIEGGGLSLLAEADVDAILAAAGVLRPDLMVVDSVQAVTAREVGSSPGGMAQVRECAGRVVRFAKEQAVSVVLVGHVTKDGGIAGPKLLEHMVDVVLYLEGELEAGLRVLRSLKNRFGPTHGVGLFEMQEDGLAEVPDPSSALLGQWRGAVPGTVAFPSVDGRRPVLVEVQALVTPSQAPQPRRSVKGLEPARVHQLLAVLERHGGLSFARHEVYVSVVGGVRVREPAADLPVALALASSFLDRPLGGAVAWGEVGLTGEVRGVPHEARRRAEAERLGIGLVIAPGGVARIGEALAGLGLSKG
ncbi:MAG: DNA repair protein RadA [Acidimicrobiia bacterium]